MKRSIIRADAFIIDSASQFAWYASEAGEPTAWRFLEALESSLARLQHVPEHGRARRFAHPALSDMRSLRVDAPFDSILVFYRITTEPCLIA